MRRKGITGRRRRRLLPEAGGEEEEGHVEWRTWIKQEQRWKTSSFYEENDIREVKMQEPCPTLRSIMCLPILTPISCLDLLPTKCKFSIYCGITFYRVVLNFISCTELYKEMYISSAGNSLTYTSFHKFELRPFSLFRLFCSLPRTFVTSSTLL